MTAERLVAHDPHDRLLVARVAPPDWKNPAPRSPYHLVVVGAGPAGLVAAAVALGLGARVALVERQMMGGDCLNFGCVPSKALIAVAERLQIARSSEAFGVDSAGVRLDAAVAFGRVRRVRSELAAHDSAERFRALGADVFLGGGRFVSPDCLAVGDDRLRFRRALIATGSSPRVPAIAGLDGVDYYTNETIFALKELPKRLAVLGGGPVGCELGQAFARLGVEVDLIESEAQLLPHEAPEAARIVAEQLARDAVNVRLETSVKQVRRAASGLRLALSGSRTAELKTDALLLAVGRRANVSGLGLEHAGVEVDDQGVSVDDHLRTTNRRIYAAGDVCAGMPGLTHAADAMARIAVQNALFFGKKRVSKLVIPRVTYTSPAVAQVGLGHREALGRGDRIREFTVPVSDLDRSAIDGQHDGFARVYVDRHRGTILGATLVAERAGESIGELAVAVTQRLKIFDLAATVHPYPTQSEVWKRVADAWSRTRLTPRVERMFAWWFRWFWR